MDHPARGRRGGARRSFARARLRRADRTADPHRLRRWSAARPGGRSSPAGDQRQRRSRLRPSQPAARHAVSSRSATPAPGRRGRRDSPPSKAPRATSTRWPNWSACASIRRAGRCCTSPARTWRATLPARWPRPASSIAARSSTRRAPPSGFPTRSSADDPPRRRRRRAGVLAAHRQDAGPAAAGGRPCGGGAPADLLLPQSSGRRGGRAAALARSGGRPATDAGGDDRRCHGGARALIHRGRAEFSLLKQRFRGYSRKKQHRPATEGRGYEQRDRQGTDCRGRNAGRHCGIGAAAEPTTGDRRRARIYDPSAMTTPPASAGPAESVAGAPPRNLCRLKRRAKPPQWSRQPRRSPGPARGGAPGARRTASRRTFVGDGAAVDQGGGWRGWRPRRRRIAGRSDDAAAPRRAGDPRRSRVLLWVLVALALLAGAGALAYRDYIEPRLRQLTEAPPPVDLQGEFNAAFEDLEARQVRLRQQLEGLAPRVDAIERTLAGLRASVDKLSAAEQRAPEQGVQVEVVKQLGDRLALLETSGRRGQRTGAAGSLAGGLDGGRPRHRLETGDDRSRRGSAGAGGRRRRRFRPATRGRARPRRRRSGYRAGGGGARAVCRDRCSDARRLASGVPVDRQRRRSRRPGDRGRRLDRPGGGSARLAGRRPPARLRGDRRRRRRWHRRAGRNRAAGRRSASRP